MMRNIIILFLFILFFSVRFYGQISITPLIGVDFLSNPNYEWGYYTHIEDKEFKKPIFVFGSQISYSFTQSLHLSCDVLLTQKKREYIISEFQGFNGGYNKIEFDQKLYSITIEKNLSKNFILGAGINLLKLGIATKSSDNERIPKIQVRNSKLSYVRPKFSIGYKLNNFTIQSYLLIGVTNINLPEPGFTHGRKINFGINLGYRMIRINVDSKSSDCPKF